MSEWKTIDSAPQDGTEILAIHEYAGKWWRIIVHFKEHTGFPGRWEDGQGRAFGNFRYWLADVPSLPPTTADKEGGE